MSIFIRIASPIIIVISLFCILYRMSEESSEEWINRIFPTYQLGASRNGCHGSRGSRIIGVMPRCSTAICCRCICIDREEVYP